MRRGAAAASCAAFDRRVLGMSTAASTSNVSGCDSSSSSLWRAWLAAAIACRLPPPFSLRTGRLLSTAMHRGDLPVVAAARLC